MVVVTGWVEAPITGAMPGWLCSTTGADFRTIPMALCSVSLDTRSSGRTWARGEHQALMDIGRPIHRSNVMNEGRVWLNFQYLDTNPHKFTTVTLLHSESGQSDVQWSGLACGGST